MSNVSLIVLTNQSKNNNNNYLRTGSYEDRRESRIHLLVLRITRTDEINYGFLNRIRTLKIEHINCCMLDVIVDVKEVRDVSFIILEPMMIEKRKGTRYIDNDL